MRIGTIFNLAAWVISAALFIWLLIDFIKVESDRKK